jgi:hypothetical protein
MSESKGREVCYSPLWTVHFATHLLCESVFVCDVDVLKAQRDLFVISSLPRDILQQKPSAVAASV